MTKATVRPAENGQNTVIKGALRPSYLAFAYLAPTVLVVGTMLSDSDKHGLHDPSRYLLPYSLLLEAVTIAILNARGRNPSALIRRWILLSGKGSLVAATSLSALVVYPLLRECYASFYRPLGVTPEDVGLNYAAVLQLSGEALAVAALLAILTSVVIAAMIGTAAVLVLAGPAMDSVIPRGLQLGGAKSKSNRAVLHIEIFLRQAGAALFLPPELALQSNSIGQVRHAVRRSLDRLIWPILLVGFLYGLVFLALLPSRAMDHAEKVREGHAVGDLTLFGFPVLPVRADGARIVMLQRQPSTLGTVPNSACLFLGQNQGALVLFFPREHRIAQIPASSVVLIRTEQDPTGDCIANR